ncbi:MAG: fibronectin type III domain-containing protein [Ruminococcus sp.]|nr:fibronectin type III domain-containing protein [Ruminococcus sp.]
MDGTEAAGSIRKPAALKRFAVLMMVIVMAAVMTDLSALRAAAQTYEAPVFTADAMYDSGETHPYNRQTDTIVLHWEKLSGAARYQLFMNREGSGEWTCVGSTSLDHKKITGLERAVKYNFKIRAVYAGNKYSEFSPVQTISTARMDYDYAGWQAMCRIVYHEVGQINDSMWDKPIVYVADCTVNRYVAAKYDNDGLWAPYYRNYSNIQQVIYNSGNFMSDAGLTRDGCSYDRVPEKVKLAVFGAVTDQAVYKDIANDLDIYYWCNRGYTVSSKIAYSFPIPWGGYFYIWRSYWG